MTTTYYKATRPAGTDFRTGQVDYLGSMRQGTLLPTLETRSSPRCCTSDVYHASVSPGDTLIGGSWPARLFEVEGEPVAEHDNKRGFYTLKVVREVEAWKALGPNGERTIEFMDSIGDVTLPVFVAIGNAAWDPNRYQGPQHRHYGEAQEAMELHRSSAGWWATIGWVDNAVHRLRIDRGIKGPQTVINKFGRAASRKALSVASAGLVDDRTTEILAHDWDSTINRFQDSSNLRESK